MANIKIIVEGALMDGHKVTFKAPCDCISVEKLDVRYIKDGEQVSKLFTMKDTHGNDLTGIGNLFMEGAYVHVILDTVRGFAYIQNAATNGYLEEKLKPILVGSVTEEYGGNLTAWKVGNIVVGSMVVFTAKSFTQGEYIEIGKEFPKPFGVSDVYSHGYFYANGETYPTMFMITKDGIMFCYPPKTGDYSINVQFSYICE